MYHRPILVIDDDPAILETITNILEFEGYPVLTARNGAEGLQIAEQDQPALVLLDMRMPVLDGWGFAAAMRARGLEIPLLVMTAAQETHHWAEEIGAAGYLAKPFDLLDLLDAMTQILGG